MRTLDSIADRQSIVERISALTSSDHRLWGRMSASQMICHLCDAYRAPLGEKYVSPTRVFVPRKLFKWVALRAPVKWPKGIPTCPEVEQGVGGTAPTEFSQDRAELLSILNRFCTEGINPALFHPIFGLMSRQDWLRWGYLHADHHLRQFGR
jgi:hypothetical protein